ncbi:hypothetical protein Golax_018806, partial [Gossypium laxum]|nr:hypothetical protein [Gossypium laxum]
MSDNLARHLCDTLGFRKVHKVGSYLGVPLFHDRVTISSLKFMVEKVKSRLYRWNARQLSLADGYTVRCWEDSWIPEIGPLVNLIPANTRFATDCCLKKMITKEGCWNLDLFRVWLLKDLIERISSILPPHPLGGPDKIAWTETSSGYFSIKDSYRKVKESLWNSVKEAWKLLWKPKVPQRVQLGEHKGAALLAIGLHEVMLGRAEPLAHLHSSRSSKFEISSALKRLQGELIGLAQASSMCPAKVSPHTCSIKAEIASLKCLASARVTYSRCSISGHGYEDMLHAIRDCDATKNEVVKGAYNWVQQYSSTHKGGRFGSHASREDFVGTDKWIRIRTDEAVKMEIGSLILIAEYEFSDNMEVIRSIKESFLKGTNSDLIMRIFQLLRKGAKWAIGYVPREDNMEADQITKLAFDREGRLQLYVASPL